VVISLVCAATFRTSGSFVSLSVILYFSYSAWQDSLDPLVSLLFSILFDRSSKFLK